MELIGCTTDKRRMIVSVDEAEVGAILNACVQEAARLDRFGGGSGGTCWTWRPAVGRIGWRCTWLPLVSRW